MSLTMEWWRADDRLWVPEFRLSQLKPITQLLPSSIFIEVTNRSYPIHPNGLAASDLSGR